MQILAETQGRRGRSRLRVRMHVRVITLFGTHNTVLLDLSLTGARIRACADMAAGQEVLLAWGTYEAFGTIIWRSDGMCGIGFEELISPASLVSTRDLEHLPSDRELDRGAARDWVQGTRRV